MLRVVLNSIRHGLTYMSESIYHVPNLVADVTLIHCITRALSSTYTPHTLHDIPVCPKLMFRSDDFEALHSVVILEFAKMAKYLYTHLHRKKQEYIIEREGEYPIPL